MPEKHAIIRTERLDLISLTPKFLQQTLANEKTTAENILGLAIPDIWFVKPGSAPHRLKQLQTDLSLQPWLLRAISLREKSAMVGHIGFHTAPDPVYLQEYTQGGGIEFGYTIFPAYRRQGYAFEASRGLMAWAQAEHGVERFILSIGVRNVSSLQLAKKLGFKRIGSHIDEVDGPEDIFEYRPG